MRVIFHNFFGHCSQPQTQSTILDLVKKIRKLLLLWLFLSSSFIYRLSRKTVCGIIHLSFFYITARFVIEVISNVAFILPDIFTFILPLSIFVYFVKTCWRFDLNIKPSVCSIGMLPEHLLKGLSLPRTKILPSKNFLFLTIVVGLRFAFVRGSLESSNFPNSLI